MKCKGSCNLNDDRYYYLKLRLQNSAENRFHNIMDSKEIPLGILKHKENV
jgi:hypothetical protein